MIRLYYHHRYRVIVVNEALGARKQLIYSRQANYWQTTSFYQDLKLSVLNYTDLSRDAIHVHIGLAVFVLVVLVWKKGEISVSCLIPVIVIALAMEALDLFDDWQSLGYLRWSASIYDLVNTCFWPMIIAFWIGVRNRKSRHL